MKFKVGDKVKVIKCDTSGVNCKNLNKVSTITEIDERNGKYPYVLRGTAEYFGEMELELLERQFTKSDLKDGDIVTYRNGDKRTVVDGNLINSCGYILKKLSQYTNELKDTVIGKSLDIVKVERPIKYETVFERKEEILDGVEKKYLANVIKPFRHKVKSIMKRIEYSSLCYIKICLKNGNAAYLPSFEENSMYKGMKPNREYTLEELGLE